MVFNRFLRVFKLSRTEFVKQNQIKVDDEKHSKKKKKKLALFSKSKDSKTYKLAYFLHSISIMHMLF